MLLKRFLELARVFGVIMLFCLLFPNPTYAVAEIDVDVLDSTILSVPSKVDLGQSLTIKMKYDNTTEEGYSLSSCQVYSQFTDGRAQSEPLFRFESGTLNVSNGGVSLSKTRTGSKYFVTEPNSLVHFSPGETATLTFKLKANSPELNEGDELYLVFGCSQNADSGSKLGLGWDPRTVKINKAEKEVSEPKEISDPVQQETPVKENQITLDSAPIAKVEIPQKFLEDNSLTTDLSKLNTESAKKVSKLTLDVPSKSKLEFREDIDLSGKEVAEKFTKLDKYVKLGKGIVYLDSKNLKNLNKKAIVTFYDVNVDLENVVIYKDGEDATENLSDLNYNNGNLSFTIEGFSEYALSPGLVLSNSKTQTTTKSSYLISGKVSDYKSNVEINVGDQVYTLENIDENGNFGKKVNLSQGENNIIVRATSVSGRIQEETIRVNFIPQDSNENVDWFYLAGRILAIPFLIGLVVLIVIEIKKRDKKKDDSVVSDKNEIEAVSKDKKDE